MTRSSGDADYNIKISINTAWNVCSVSPKNTSDDKHTNPHSDSAVDEEGTTTSVINEEENDSGKYDEESILDAPGNQVDVSSQTGHLKNVDNIICC